MLHERRYTAPTGSDAIEGLSLTLTLGELERRLDDFLNEYLKTKSAETVGTYRRSLHEFERWFVQQKGRFRFTTDGVEAYKKYLMETRKLSQVSVSTMRSEIRPPRITAWPGSRRTSVFAFRIAMIGLVTIHRVRIIG